MTFEQGKPDERARERARVRAIAQEIGLPFVDLSIVRSDPAALALLGSDVAERLQALPLRLDGSRLYVALARPNDLETLDELRLTTRRQVLAVMAASEDIRAEIVSAYARLDDLRPQR